MSGFIPPGGGTDSHGCCGRGIRCVWLHFARGETRSHQSRCIIYWLSKTALTCRLSRRIVARSALRAMPRLSRWSGRGKIRRKCLMDGGEMHRNDYTGEMRWCISQAVGAIDDGQGSNRVLQQRVLCQSFDSQTRAGLSGAMCQQLGTAEL